jgi:hypothetical protein
LKIIRPGTGGGEWKAAGDHGIAPDSIGHIFVASNNELIGANTISGVETRRDGFMIIGNENWIDFKSLSLEQLAMLNIVLIAPSYVDRDNYRLNELNSRIIIRK